MNYDMSSYFEDPEFKEALAGVRFPWSCASSRPYCPFRFTPM
jgi:hypothetical protein